MRRGRKVQPGRDASADESPPRRKPSILINELTLCLFIRVSSVAETFSLRGNTRLTCQDDSFDSPFGGARDSPCVSFLYGPET